MSLGASLARSCFIATWKLRQSYHRFEIVGLDAVDRPGPALIAGYHGRPIASDLVMLMVHLLDRGIVCRPIVHDSLTKVPPFKQIAQGMGFLAGDGPELERAIAQGHKIIVTPGGGRECTRASNVRYKVDWGARMGYAKMALRHRLPVIPAAGSGVDDQYLSLIDGYQLARDLGLPRKVMLFWGMGPLGPFPFSPPFPVKMTLRLGRPIPPEGDPEDESACRALHDRVVLSVQGLLDAGRKENPLAILKHGEEVTWA
jgi:1-acyl-sn-glycerol-3-phosphate acyltransferase